LKQLLLITASFILIVLLTENCAKIGSPEGGPKDISPPEIEECTPENRSVNFKESRIVIDFDEYVQLKELNKHLVISPPCREKPDVRIKGKSVIIEIMDEPRENTTYNYNFGDAIVDINENNPLKNFHYVFSTGSYIDSLSVSGSVVNAFTLQPEETILVMLYRTDRDSLLYNDTALYISKTDENGQFTIDNIRGGEYFVFAVYDANNNMLLDPGEPLAFPDSSVMAVLPPVSQTDTIQTDSVQTDTIETEAVQTDTTGISDSVTAQTEGIKLFLFEEDLATQYLKQHSREQKYKCTYIFNRSLKDSIQIEPLNFKAQAEWNIMEYNATDDSVICWITDSVVFGMDTIELAVRYKIKDSLENYVSQTDTLELIFKEEEKKKKNKDDIEDTDYLDISANVKSGQVLDLNKNIIVTCSAPVARTDTNLLKIAYISDSVETACKYDLVKDTAHMRKYKIMNMFEENSKYRLMIMPKAFSDIYGRYNDTLFTDFSTQTSDYYGNVVLELSNVKTNIIVQLLNDNEDIMREYFANNDRTIKMEYLSPVVTYKIKFIYDSNSSKNWDTGNYIKKIQPEKIIYYPQNINVRSNWDIELKWLFSE